MSYASKILILLVIISFIGGFLAIMTWDMSPEVSIVEETIYPEKSKD